MISVWDFGVSVTLTKVVTRKGSFASTVRTLDLTSVLGDRGSIRTAKSVREGAGGFSLTFADRISSITLDTLYSEIEPMDLIEIRASRKAWAYRGGKLPLLMRGYVSSVRRIRQMGGDGVPEQVVVVQGQDSGKLLLINQILFMLAYTQGEPYIDTFKLQAITGLDAGAQNVGTFMRSLIEKVANPKIQKLAAVSSNLVKPFLTDRITVTEGTVIPQTLANFEGSVLSLAHKVADRPWNELYVEDAEDGPELVFRPTPFKDLNGSLILPGAADPGSYTITPEDVVSVELGRADAGVANFFFVPPSGMALDTQFSMTVGNAGKIIDTGYENNDPTIYGTRQMQLESMLGPTGWGAAPSTLSVGQQAQASSDGLAWVNARNKALEAMNRDNAVFEEGSLECRGSETIRAGQYVHVPFGSIPVDAYVPAVSHSIAPMRTWTTNLALERSTNFYKRDQASTGQPGWAEGRPGVYDQQVST
jgi:hypothetical protein